MPTLGRAGRKAAAVAIFHFKIGMVSILAACSFVGILLYFLGALSGDLLLSAERASDVSSALVVQSLNNTMCTGKQCRENIAPV